MPRSRSSIAFPSRSITLAFLLAAGLFIGSSAAADDTTALRAQAKSVIGELPKNAATEARPMTEARIDLGRQLYYDPRLSKNHDISCNSCHQLDRFGVDGEPTSPGHKGQRGGRNSPTSMNAALHIAQFWDGREPDVEAQAKGPVLNPVEMAMPSPEAVVAVLKSIPGYGPAFGAAFPGESDPITYDNMATAIGAFERGLLTPAPIDRFIAGKDEALSSQARKGFTLFLQNGCVSCHTGPAIGGGMYRKMGLVKPYQTSDQGRFDVTANEADRHVFKVPSLRNITKTGPYLHDGSVAKLDEVVRLMGWHQLGIDIPADDRKAIVSFLESLTGSVDAAYVAKPELPASGPKTPKPDPS
jgi:cytochrome c peroxidase